MLKTSVNKEFSRLLQGILKQKSLTPFSLSKKLEYHNADSYF